MKLGTILTIDHPAIVEIAGLAAFDWIWIDGEGCESSSQRDPFSAIP
jgi:2-keto-3-deoxy-L-rhamnonate aldolase RhmA